jgi:MoxR-like ATPase
MSDVAAIHNLVQKRNELKKRDRKIIVGQDAVVDQVLLCIFREDMRSCQSRISYTLMVNTLAQALGLTLREFSLP